MAKLNVSTFLGQVSRMVNTSQESRFPIISKLTTSFLSFPHSNADVERIFSHVTHIKIKTRNSMKTKTFDAIILTKQSLPCTFVVCKCVNLEMYDSDESSDSDNE